MSAFLYFRSMCTKLRSSELMFLMLRIKQFLYHEYVVNPLTIDEDTRLMKHITVPNVLWNEAWWRQMRIYSKNPLFALVIRKYL